MNRLSRFSLPVVLALACAVPVLTGCARAARSTEGFARHDSTVIDAPFPEAWLGVRDVLLDMDLTTYTRDKRGVFIAYGDEERNLLLVPHRRQYTIELDPVDDQSTMVTVETVRQVHGVTLLTYPGWHDRPTGDAATAEEILERLETRLSGSPPAMQTD